MANGQMMLGDFAPPLLTEFNQFHTPMKLARRVVRWAGLSPRTRNRASPVHVLEPSAGGGNIVRALVEAGANVVAIEIDPAWCHILRQQFKTVSVIPTDFFKFKTESVNEFDLVIMNPPLTNGVACEHVAHALKFAPRVISVMRSQDLHGVERHKQLWCNCDLRRKAHCVRRPIYSGDGGKIETVIVDVYRKGTCNKPQCMEHWADDWRE